MRYVHIPAPIALVHPETGEPMLMLDPETKKANRVMFPWDAFARGLFLHPQITQLDMIGVFELHTKVAQAKAGQLIELNDEAWELLCKLARSPAGMVPQFAIQSEPFVRAVVDAKTEGTAAHAEPAKPVTRPKKAR